MIPLIPCRHCGALHCAAICHACKKEPFTTGQVLPSHVYSRVRRDLLGTAPVAISPKEQS